MGWGTCPWGTDPWGVCDAVVGIVPPPPSAPTLPCPRDPFDQQHFLDMFDRLYPQNYIGAMKLKAGPGYEVFQSYGNVGQRLSLANVRLECGNFILSASGGTFATVSLHLFRGSGGPAVTIKAGTVFSTSTQNRQFVLLRDVTFGNGDVGPFAAAAQAVLPGWEWNVRGERTTAGGELLPGNIDTIVTTLQADPATGLLTFIDPTIQVSQPTDAGGGAAPMLDQLGEDRGLPRLPGEPDSYYRARIRTLPDTVSPDAINRQIRAALAPYGASSQYEFVETFNLSYQTCYDAPSAPIAGSPFDPNLFTYDDPRPTIPFRNRYMDENEYRGCFITVLPNLPCLQDVGFAYDDIANNPSEFVSPGGVGRRATDAYDVPSSADPTLILQGGYDGFDLPKQVVYKGIFDLLQRIKPAGVAAPVELLGQ